MKLRVIIRGKGIVKGEVARVGFISLLGDADPEKGTVTGVSVAGRILAMEGIRGSTVGPYVMWGMARRGLAPLAIVAKKVDLVLVTAAAMSGIPLLQGELPWDCAIIDLESGEASVC